MSQGYCLNCKSQGVIWALPIKGEEGRTYGPFVFKCTCAWGQADWRRYPIWNSYWKKHFKIDHKSGDPDPKPLGDAKREYFTATPYADRARPDAGFENEADIF